MSPELEAMAKAISVALSDFDWRDLNGYSRSEYGEAARAALLAIREPTEAMVFAALDMADTLGPLGPTATWQAMIDHILNGEPE